MSNKGHVKYYLKSGTLVPGVTTILNILGKQSLIEWAYQCGLKNIDYKKVRDSAGDVGTLTHYLILCDLKGEKPDLSEYSPDDIKTAELCMENYRAWKGLNNLNPMMIESPMVSETYGYGGTLDLYATLNSRNVLVDFKTSKGIYDSFLYQTAAYWQLIQENTAKIPDAILIVRIPKTSRESFETRFITDPYKYFDVFRHCLCIYALQKELG